MRSACASSPRNFAALPNANALRQPVLQHPLIKKESRVQNQAAATLHPGKVVFVVVNGNVRQAVVNKPPVTVLNDVFVEVRLGCVHLRANTSVLNADRLFFDRSDAVTAANLMAAPPAPHQARTT